MKKLELAAAVSLALGSSLAQAATITVNSSVSGTDADSNTTTLLEALNEANSTPGDDTIVFDSSLSGQSINIPPAYAFTVTENLTINGESNNITLVNVGEGDYLNIYNESSTVDLTINNLSLIANGSPAQLINNQQNAGTITINNSTIDSSSSGTPKGIVSGSANLYIVDTTISNFVNRAVEVSTNTSTTIGISGSTFSDNSSIANGGGALHIDTSAVAADVDLDIVNSTFSGNTTGALGGAIELYGNFGDIDADILHTTIANNVGNSGGGGIAIHTDEGGSVDLTLENAIVYDNTTESSPNDLYIEIAGNTTTTAINSIIGSISGGSLTSSVNVLSSDPLLGSLAANGGNTETLLPGDGSPAINAGNPDAIIPSTDQRGEGYSRYRDSAPDMGAVEIQSGTDHFASTDDDKKSSSGSSAFGPLSLMALLLPWLRRRR